MNPVHYAAVRFSNRWKLVGRGLRWGDYPTLEAALAAAQRMAEEARGNGLDVEVHVHDEFGILHRLPKSDDDEDEPATWAQ